METESTLTTNTRKYVGKSDKGEAVFIYPKGIKIHKKYWIKEASIDTSNQIFMMDEMSGFDRSKPLYLFEGEKDAIRSPLQGISFSAGATSIPKNIDTLYDFNEVVIVYDNDKAGEQGAKKVAERIKSESPTTKVLIAQWESSLPKGYDVYDDYEKEFKKLMKPLLMQRNMRLDLQSRRILPKNKKDIKWSVH